MLQSMGEKGEYLHGVSGFLKGFLSVLKGLFKGNYRESMGEKSEYSLDSLGILTVSLRISPLFRPLTVGCACLNTTGEEYVP